MQAHCSRIFFRKRLAWDLESFVSKPSLPTFEGARGAFSPRPVPAAGGTTRICCWGACLPGGLSARRGAGAWPPLLALPGACPPWW